MAGDLLLRDDPVTHLRPLSPRPFIARIGSNDIDLILTRISASFGATTRELNQNGNWIRIIPIMESFARPPRSVPSDDLTIRSVSSGQSADAFEGMGHGTNSVVNINRVSPHARRVAATAFVALHIVLLSAEGGIAFSGGSSNGGFFAEGMPELVDHSLPEVWLSDGPTGGRNASGCWWDRHS